MPTARARLRVLSRTVLVLLISAMTLVVLPGCGINSSVTSNVLVLAGAIAAACPTFVSAGRTLWECLWPLDLPEAPAVQSGVQIIGLDATDAEVLALLADGGLFPDAPIFPDLPRRVGGMRTDNCEPVSDPSYWRG